MKNNIKTLTLGFTLAIGGGITSVALYKQFEAAPKTTANQIALPTNNHFASNTLEIIQPTSLELAAKRSINSVVHVKTEVLVNRPVDPFYQYIYGRKQQAQLTKSSGSGVILSNDGYIVTNNHVIDNAKKISITLNNNKTYEAQIIGTDPNTDIALLKIEEEGLPFIQYGNSNEINIGEWVLAVGNPYNLTSTVTAGIISAKGRDINILKNDPFSGLSAVESFIQTDAAVNPGNSGGALVSSSGELIGINSAIKSKTGSYTGYSFAIPVNIVKKVVRDLKEFGSVQRAFIGVSIRDIDEALAQEIGVEDISGVYINGTTENGSAAKSGIKTGDIIKKIGNKKINNVTDLQEQISQFRPGDEIIIGVVRDNKKTDLALILKNVNGNEKIISNNSNKILKLLGAKFSKPNAKELSQLNIASGVKIDELYSGKLRSVGIRKGFIITKINHQKIKSINELTETISKLKGGMLIEGVYQNGRREFYGIGV